ncbi:chromatin modification-related protein EAF7-like [Camellia sinensis]|uniref:chromatin modification-related protein EAF7-like n=1 Tax=Camellia sinensis TaxID=4442 RepID=UPI001036A2B7|nr:chromatin modification-related protein EAF7-like [Camellia sinensis]
MVKKAKTKATVIQIDSDDTLSISKLAEVEKSTSAAEKRPAEADPSESTKSKKPRSDSAVTSGSLKSDDPWAPSIMIEDKPIRAGDSASDIEVGVALSTALLLPNDLNCMAEAIQHAHSFAMQPEEMKKELVHKTKEAIGLLKSLNNAEAKMKALIDQAKVAKQAQDDAEEKAGAAKAVAEDEGEEKEEEDGEENEDEEAEVAADAEVSTRVKSLTLNEQVLDLTQDEENEVSKGASPKKTASEVPIAEKSLDQTLQEIDAEHEVENAAEKISHLSSRAETQPATDVE